MLEPILKSCAGLDIHKKTIVGTVLFESSNGDMQKEVKEYGTFKKELVELGIWLRSLKVELVVMESTGIYWKSIYRILESFGLKTYVVNAQYVKKVPGRKTDVSDSEWLAELSRVGLLKPSFIPPKDLRELRMVTRYRRKLSGILASEKNRLHKILEDGGIKLGSVVSDINGKSSSRMIQALISGRRDLDKIAELSLGQLRNKREELTYSLDGDLSDRHLFLLQRLQSHINWLEGSVDEIDALIVSAMEPYKEEWKILQTIPGIDWRGAAMLIAEIGVDMSAFPTRNHISSWAGVCSGNNESASKKKVAELENQIHM